MRGGSIGTILALAASQVGSPCAIREPSVTWRDYLTPAITGWGPTWRPNAKKSKATIKRRKANKAARKARRA